MLSGNTGWNEESRGLGFDRQSMDATRDQIAQGIIHKPVPLNGAQSGEAWALDVQRKVRAFDGTTAARVTRVRRAVIGHHEVCGLQGRLQCGFDVGGADGMV
jgi:hypothetical protein